MKIFATSFSIVLGAWRLRFSLDLDDETFASPAPPHHARVVAERERQSVRRSATG